MTLAMRRAAAAALAALATSPQGAIAHALGERYELPAPVWLFILAGALTVTVTFVAVAAFARAGAERYARAACDVSCGVLGRLLLNPTTVVTARVAAVVMLAAIAVAGVIGSREPARNLAPTAVWIVWWVGFSYVAMLLGNVWPAVNPWRALHDWMAPAAPPVRAPAPSAWVGVGLLLAFGWLELIFPYKANPRWLAGLIGAYTLATLFAMRRYGAEAWLAQGDPFHRVFDLLGRFAPLGAGRDGGLALRPVAAGLMRDDGPTPRAADVALIVAMLAIVLFDGLMGSSHWTAIEDAIHDLNPRLGDVGWIAVHTAGLLGTWLAFLGLYYLAVALAARMAGGGSRMRSIAGAFALSLMPIAVGYHFAHTFTYLLVQGQGAIALASDPLGWGWDLFGTRDRPIDIAVIGARTAWYLAFAAIVIGHAISVYLAHVAAERQFEQRGRALWALLPMTVLMVVYTAISLQILAEPLVRYTGPQETII
ncbi:MAG: hypothetical protein JNK67_09420 [Alphaproteobacteria bacterium]|nr:hypothetical protein [Alphaproteobacteria bacterium]